MNTVGVNGCNLYMYDRELPAGQGLVDVSAGDTSGLGPEVQGVMAVSADGSHVYFVAKGVLAGENTEHRSPVEDADNLYLYEHEGASAKTTFIATLPGGVSETPQWTTGAPGANVTADGRFLVFTSAGALTAGTRAGGGEQVYRYDAQGGQLLRVSIGQHGFDDDGNEGTGNARLAFPNNATVAQARRDPSMADDGSRVFFQSPMGLTRGRAE